MNARLDKLQRLLSEQSPDTLLITNTYNILYLTGFAGLSPEEREAYVIVTQNKIYLLTDGRYFTEKLRVKNLELRVETKFITYQQNFMFHFQEIIRNEEIKTLGFEAEDLKFAEYEQLVSHLRGVKFIPTKHLVGKLRTHKDTEEITAIAKACRITDQCLKEIVPRIEIDMSEKEIAHRMEFWIKRKGYDLAFEPIIVAVDRNSAIPHYDPRAGNGKVKNGSVVLIDFGVKYKNYISDITRMFFVGKPSSEVVNTYNHLLTVQKKTIEQLNNDNNLKSIDAFCRSELQKNGLPDFAHGTGHGIGLEIHEEPRVSPLATAAVADGQVFTIEPGVYREGKWGMRIEDSVVMQNGKAQILTKFSKKLLIL